MTPLEERVELERARIFFDLARGNMAAMLMGAMLVTLVLHLGGVAWQSLLIWGLLLSLACAVVLLFERHARRVGVTSANGRRLMHRRVALGGVVALFYGLSGFMLPDAATRDTDSFLFAVMTTVVTVGALSFNVMPLHYRVLAAACFGPMTLHYLHRYLVHADAYYLLLIAVSVIWLAVVLAKAHRVSGTAIEAIVLNMRLQDEVEEHKRTKASIQVMALHDPLTALGNRRHFDDVLTRAIGNAQRDLSRFGLLAIDLDEFKPVNDRFGHAVGDALLRSVAMRLQSATRSGDFCARVGGDEFAVVVGGLANDTACRDAAVKVRALLEPPHLLGSIEAASPASVGWATYPDDGKDLESLMAVADERMYRDKAERRAARLALAADTA